MHKQEHYDTYFFNEKEALRTAKQQNRISTSIKTITALQICYYTSNKKLKNAPANCIFLELENVYNYLVTTKNRFPKAISFERSTIDIQEQADIKQAFCEIMDSALKERENLVYLYAQRIFETIPDFNKKPLRVFIPASRETTVMQYVAKNIAEAFEEIGCEVLYFIQDELGTCTCNLPMLIALDEFKPHLTVNINHLNNTYINENIFNFVWFQDDMSILYDNTPIEIRGRDYIFVLTNTFKELLFKKNIDENKITYQPFATNPKLFLKKTDIEREDKIVFLGSDYNFENDEEIDENLKNELYNHIDNNTLTFEKIKDISIKNNFDLEDFKTFIITSFVRRRVIVWLCSLENIKIEIYGTDTWLNNPEVIPYYKGLLPYGEEMAKVYNSAKYAIAAHPFYKYQQRLIEMSACGTIPIVYESPMLSEDFSHNENILSFSTKDELKKCIGQRPKKDPSQISEDISYKKMANKIIKTIKNDLEGNK